MTKKDLANEILAEQGLEPLAPDESPDEVISDGALCGLCLEEVISAEELERIVERAADIDQWHDLVSEALSHHDCAGDGSKRGDGTSLDSEDAADDDED